MARNYGAFVLKNWPEKFLTSLKFIGIMQIMVANKDNEMDESLEPTGEDNFDEPELVDEEASGQDKLKTLRGKLKVCEEEKRQHLEDLQRARADFLNSKKRLEEEALRRQERHETDHIEKLLPLCDSFAMAMNDEKAWETTPESWRKGMEGIHNQLLNLLASYNIAVVNPLGETFDPNIHEAVSNVPVEEKTEDGKIISVLQLGYVRKANGKKTTIRPARVTVGELKQ